MLRSLLLAAQIAVLIAIGILLWQIWHLLHRKDIPEDEPLGEKRVKYLSHRLTAIGIGSVLEAALCIAQAVLRFMEGS